jgi:acetyl-CoA synthetase
VVAHRREAGFDTELQVHVQQRLSRHEYPRLIEIVDALPKTPAGKVNRKALRDRASRA